MIRIGKGGTYIFKFYITTLDNAVLNITIKKHNSVPETINLLSGVLVITMLGHYATSALV